MDWRSTSRSSDRRRPSLLHSAKRHGEKHSPLKTPSPTRILRANPRKIRDLNLKKFSRPEASKIAEKCRASPPRKTRDLPHNTLAQHSSQPRNQIRATARQKLCLMWKARLHKNHSNV